MNHNGSFIYAKDALAESLLSKTALTRTSWTRVFDAVGHVVTGAWSSGY
jgi:hypothetical protein